jgi:hypothetical protein
MARKLLEMIVLGASVEADCVVVDNKRLAFNVKLGADDVVDATGKLKKFADLDTFINAALKQNPSATEMVLTVDVAGVRQPRIPASPVAQATADKAAFEKRKASAIIIQTKAAADLVAIASYQNSPNSLLAARYVELAARKTAIDDSITWYDAQIAAANAIINPTP